MSNFPANAQGLAAFKRTMVTQYNGTCHWCGEATHSGLDFFSYGHDGSKVSSCHVCAVSVPAMIQRVLGRIVAVQDQLTQDQLAQIDLPTNYAEAIAGQLGERETQMVLVNSYAAWLQVEAFTKVAPVDARVEALRAALPLLSAKDRDFGGSLVAQFDTRGSLSEKQWPWVEKLAAKATPAAALPEADFGIHVLDNGDVYRVYKTQNGRRGARLFNGVVFDYAKGGTAVVDKAVAAGTARTLSEAEAAEWGIAHKLCFNCLSLGLPGDLSDDRSLAAGYGETCARNNGWSYPTAEQAAAILRDRCVGHTH